MKIFLDCSLLSVGGGIQVGLSVIENIVNEPFFEVLLVCSPQINHQLSDEIKSKLNSCIVVPNVSFYKKTKQGKFIHNLEKQFQPQLVFNVFGPSYWRSDSKSLQGFALGKMLYPEVRQHYTSIVARIKETLFNFIKQKLLFKNADHFVVETQVVKERMIQKFNLASNKIHVISNCYSPAFEQRLNDRQKAIFPDPNFKTVFIPASFYVHKNLLILPIVLSKLNKLTAQKVIFKFTIPEDSMGWKEISRIAADYDVVDQLVTVGHVPNQLICDEYLSSDVVLCSSLIESSTAVFPESFIAQRPLLVSDRDFARNLCEDAALYFNPLDASDIAAKIHLILSDESIYRALVSNSLAILKKNYLSPSEKWQQQKKLLIQLAF